jgi:adenosylhomocysteinase
MKDVIGNCVGAVEQTTNGIWRDEELLDEGLILEFPVLSIPDCRLKKLIEPKFVGKAVIRNVINLLSKVDDFIAGRKICVVGYGTIGEYIAKEARDQKAIVSVTDLDYVRLLTARLDGFLTDSLENLLKESDIVIGSTGRVAIKREGLLKLKNNAILANASSKQLEFNRDDLKSLCIRKTQTDIGIRYELANGNTILLLADGFPVNFFSAESVPGRIIDLILTLLFLGGVLLTKKKMKAKIYKWSEEDKQCGIYIDEDDVAKLHHDIYFP